MPETAWLGSDEAYLLNLERTRALARLEMYEALLLNLTARKEA